MGTDKPLFVTHAAAASSWKAAGDAEQSIWRADVLSLASVLGLDSHPRTLPCSSATQAELACLKCVTHMHRHIHNMDKHFRTCT